MTKIGQLGEQLVAKWLEARGGLILHSRWRCRWGEIDLIVQQPCSTISFVEVKTRSPHNWDADGMLAITPQKQAKLWQTAEMFLSQSPSLASFPCRFDVVLVSYKIAVNYKRDGVLNNLANQSVEIGNPILYGGYHFTIHNYLESAFD